MPPKKASSSLLFKGYDIIRSDLFCARGDPSQTQQCYLQNSLILYLLRAETKLAQREKNSLNEANLLEGSHLNISEKNKGNGVSAGVFATSHACQWFEGLGGAFLDGGGHQSVWL